MAERLERFRRDFDHFRSAVVNEPRGSDAIVGALLCEPSDPTLRRRRDLLQQRRLPGHVRPRHHRPRGHARAPGPDRARGTLPHRDAVSASVEARLLDANRGHRPRTCRAIAAPPRVTVDAPGIGPVTGDVAWGGNWFFLVGDHGQALDARRRRSS